MANNDRVRELVGLLKEASDAYYNGDAPVMSDAEYDRLRDELEILDPKNDFLAQVGASVNSALQKVRLTIPMGSLDKVNTVDEFETWLNSTVRSVAGTDPEFALQPKLDGSSIEIAYKDGKLLRAATRGDGVAGEDVTHAIRKARGVPKTINIPGDVFVRGESILSIADWEKHFKPEGDKNPRNSSNGTTRRTDGDGAQYLNFIAFNIIVSGAKHSHFDQKMSWLATLGFTVAHTEVVRASKMAEAVARWQAKREKYEFEIDGVVVKLNSESDQEKLGENNNRPYWARAWKFPALGGHSVIKDATYDVGTRGTITPVAVIEPLDVGGVTITNVTLHNMSEIERKGICIGDEVEVVRAGDVIPYIVRVVNQGANRKSIGVSSCPACGGSVVRDGPFLKCANSGSCSGVQEKRIKGWISKRDIKYLGDSNLGMLLEKGVIKNIPEIYFMTKPAMVAAGIGDRMADKILEEVKKSMDVQFSDLVGSLSLDLLGRRQAKKIVEAGFVTLQQWRDMKASDLMQHDGFKDTKAGRIVDGLRDAWPLIIALTGMLNVQYQPYKKPQAVATSGVLGGKTFCFTGAMEKPRKELQAIVEAKGGVNRDDVNGDLDYLVIEDINSTSSKAKKARKHGIKLLSESDFLTMAGA